MKNKFKVGDVVRRKKANIDDWWKMSIRADRYTVIEVYNDRLYISPIGSNTGLRNISVESDKMEMVPVETPKENSNSSPFKVGDKILLKNGKIYHEIKVVNIADDGKAVKSEYTWFNIGPSGEYKFIQVVG